jgi:hypothetical protein
LKIVASQDLGQLGSEEAKSVVYNWKWHYSAPAMLLWLILAGTIVLVKDNRSRYALLILIPLLTVNLFWSIFLKMTPVASSSLSPLNQIVVSLSIAIAVVWLLAHKLANRNRFITFLLALATMAIVCFAGVISYSGFCFNATTSGVVIILGVLTFTMLLAFVLAGWRCRKRYSGVRFMLWLAVWCVGMCILLMLVFLGIWMLASSVSVPISVYLYLGIILGQALVIGGLLYAALFPFMILAFRSGFFRQRFYACFRLTGMTETVGTGAERGTVLRQIDRQEEPGNEDFSL